MSKIEDNMTLSLATYFILPPNQIDLDDVDLLTLGVDKK